MPKYYTEKILDVIDKETQQIIGEIDNLYNEEAEKLIADLEENSPSDEKRKHRKYEKYKKSWYKTSRDEGDSKIIYVRNKRADLTGILEWGRIVKGKIVGERPHIDGCTKRSERRIKKRMKSEFGGN